MDRPKRYDPQAIEPELADRWETEGIYRFDLHRPGPVFAIDTPPPSVSGNLHMGNVYSYCHTDFIARYRRMSGNNVFYPMGFDDNGLPSERLVERKLGITAREVGREAFIEACLRVTREVAGEYQAVWRRLGLSVDRSHTYHTIDDTSRRTAQSAFLRLLQEGRAYRREAPVIWCPECRTAIAQAEVDDLERQTEFITLAFRTDNGQILPVATTRSELLPACVAVFVNPSDNRFRDLVGREVTVPLTEESVPVFADQRADPAKGTGAVMCCTFGDSTDIEWWYEYGLPLKPVVTSDGRLAAGAGPGGGKTLAEARRETIAAAERAGHVLDRRPAPQSVRVHERCGTPIEYLVTPQWFIRVLDRKAELLEAGERIRWVPPHMHARYREWIEGLRWDWLISRQRAYGVPFPIWYCACGEVLAAKPEDLPVDPTSSSPPQPCSCGRSEYSAETDVMDTWATSSLTPQIAGRKLEQPDLYRSVFPMALRPQAHEIIRTWAFYTIVQSMYESARVPWSTIMISGWGLAPEGAGKISKSKGGGPMSPGAMLQQHSADAVRYWAASTGTGKDAVISEEKIEAGEKLVTKLWNVYAFSRRFLGDDVPEKRVARLSLADRWILSTAARLIDRCTTALDNYDYATAKNETETYFWHHLADNYLEMAKGRLYDDQSDEGSGARYALYHAFECLLTLLAPFLPFVTDAIYRELYSPANGVPSIHLATWPHGKESWLDPEAEEAGRILLSVAAGVRRYKSDRSLSLGASVERVVIGVPAHSLQVISQSAADIRSVTRASEIDLVPASDSEIRVEIQG